MENLNEFIISNRDSLQNAFDRLTMDTATEHRQIFPVPNNHKQAALCTLYNHMLSNYGKLKGQLSLIGEASTQAIVTSKLSEIFDGKEQIAERG